MNFVDIPCRMKRGRGIRIGDAHPGITHSFELALRFAAWVQSMHREPTWREIANHFDVHRATAYRWLNAWRAACRKVRP
jgi:hypothetical protein